MSKIEVYLEELIYNIQSIQVKDYGDFKRKSVTYIERAKELAKSNTSDLRLLNDLKNIVLYKNDEHIEKTRAKIINTIN